MCSLCVLCCILGAGGAAGLDQGMDGCGTTPSPGQGGTSTAGGARGCDPGAGDCGVSGSFVTGGSGE